MNLYTFKLESFHINNTRSRQDDTDTVSFGFQVGGNQFPVKSFFAGNLNNGDYPINLAFGPVLISGDTIPAVFTYSIYNGNAGALPSSLVALNQTFLNQVVSQIVKLEGEDTGYPNFSSGEAGADIPSGDDPFEKPLTPQDSPFDETSDWSGLFLEAIVSSIGGFLFPDCDGFVAGDGIGLSKKQWDEAINSAGGTTLGVTMHYPGSDSPAGCGSNSDYTVTWSVTRETIHGSVLKALSSQGIQLHPGLRSLSQP
jgi:hypothetical protein